MSRRTLQFLPLLFMITLLTSGCAQDKAPAAATAQKQEGVTEIKTTELKALMVKKTDFMLIDARPGKRYTGAHMPGAVNISVPDYKKKAAAVLPKDKDKLLIFYCGGPT